MGDYPGLFQWAQCNHKGPYMGEREAEEPEMWQWKQDWSDGGQESRSAGSFQGEKGVGMDSALELPEETQQNTI